MRHLEACQSRGLVDRTIASYLADMDCPYELLFHNCLLEQSHYGPHLCWCGFSWVLRDGKAAPATTTR